MAKNNPASNTPPEAVISIIGAGMTIEGDSDTDGSLRIEGTIRGNVRAGKSVVVGKGGLVDGSIYTQDAVIAGRVSGGIHAVSRLELQATSEVSGEIEAPRMQVEEGAKVQGRVAVGESALEAVSQPGKPQTPTGGGKAEPKTEPVESEGREKSAKSEKSEGSVKLEGSENSENSENSKKLEGSVDSEGSVESEGQKGLEGREGSEESEESTTSEKSAKLKKFEEGRQEHSHS